MSGWDDISAWRADLASLRSVIGVFGSQRFLLEAVGPFLEQSCDARIQACQLLCDAVELDDCPLFRDQAEAEHGQLDPDADESQTPLLWRALLSSLVVNLGHRKAGLRKLALQTLHAFAKLGCDGLSVLHYLVEVGLSHDDWRVRLHTALAIQAFAPPGTLDATKLARVLDALATLLRDPSELVAHGAGQALELAAQSVSADVLQQALAQCRPETQAAVSDRHDSEAAREESPSPRLDWPVDSPDLDRTYSDDLPEDGKDRILSHDVLSQLECQDWKDRDKGLAGLHEQLVEQNFAQVKHVEKSEVMRVLNRLLNDAHFKIVLSTLQTIRHLCSTWHRHVLPVVHAIVPGLVERLADHKQVIRRTSQQCFGQVFQAIDVIAQPRSFFSTFVAESIIPHLDRGNWQVRKELMGILVMAMLILKGTAVNDDVMKALAQAQRDVPQVQSAAMEGLATASSLGRDVVTECKDLEVPEEVVEKVKQRLERAQTPQIVDGVVSYPPAEAPPEHDGTDRYLGSAATSRAGSSASRPEPKDRRGKSVWKAWRQLLDDPVQASVSPSKARLRDMGDVPRAGTGSPSQAFLRRVRREPRPMRSPSEANLGWNEWSRYHGPGSAPNLQETRGELVSPLETGLRRPRVAGSLPLNRSPRDSPKKPRGREPHSRGKDRGERWHLPQLPLPRKGAERPRVR